MALFNRIKVWNSNEILTANDLNDEFDNLLDGFAPDKIDGLSATVSDMLTNVSPGSTGSESLAGSLQDEIWRLRYVIKELKGTPNWYTPGAASIEALKTQVDGFLTNLMPPGMIAPYGGTTAPTNWLLCDGTAYARTGTYANLFTAIGTNFGYGDNSTTFNVPDLRGMFLRGAIPALTSTGSGNVNNSNYYATFTSHGLRTGQRIVFTGGAIGATSFAGGLSPAFVRVIDANTVVLYNSPTNATNIGSTTGILPYDGLNTATIKQAQDPDTTSHFRQMPGGNSTGVGSGQGDMLSNHIHETTVLESVTADYQSLAGFGTSVISQLYNNYSAVPHQANAIGYSGSGVGFETRPLSTTVSYIIRY